MSLPVALAFALLIMVVLFSITYWVCRRFDNYGFVDVVWAYSFTPLAWFFALNATGWSLRQLVIAALASAWSIRLGSHLYKRVASHHPKEDSRYAQLREDWEDNFGPMMFGFFLLQALTVVLLGLPFIFPAYNDATAFSMTEIIGTAIVFLALTSEALADGQLSAFVRKPENKGKVCNVGFWRYSRHPNYFFEWCIWVGFGVFALGSSFGWIALIAPASIYYLLRYKTGVPMAEASSLKSKGDQFREYQRTTNEFFPGPRRNSPSS
jgi:steroid 5-alpha reductase family enzyme